MWFFLCINWGGYRRTLTSFIFSPGRPFEIFFPGGGCEIFFLYKPIKKVPKFVPGEGPSISSGPTPKSLMIVYVAVSRLFTHRCWPLRLCHSKPVLSNLNLVRSRGSWITTPSGIKLLVQHLILINFQFNPQTTMQVKVWVFLPGSMRVNGTKSFWCLTSFLFLAYNIR